MKNMTLQELITHVEQLIQVGAVHRNASWNKGYVTGLKNVLEQLRQLEVPAPPPPTPAPRVRHNEIVAKNIINQFWLGQVMRAANHTLYTKSHVLLYPPTPEQYRECERLLDILTQPTELDLKLAVPASELPS